MKSKPHRKIESIAQYNKKIVLLLSEEQHEKLHEARKKLQVSINEIIRHATFEVYLPEALDEK